MENMDIKFMQEHPCRCCCEEHTFTDCEARAWGGCRSGLRIGESVEQGWAEHYAKYHGMDAREFFGLGDD